MGLIIRRGLARLVRMGSVSVWVVDKEARRVSHSTDLGLNFACTVSEMRFSLPLR